MKLLASGRDSDVYLHGPGRVLRRYRDGRSAQSEAATIRALGELGYPVPGVHGGSGPDIVMDHVPGPTLAAALQSGALDTTRAAAVLASLHDRLHALAWPGAPIGQSLVHLDLHPLNVIVTDHGPVVIDWSNARPGPAGLDVAMTSLILAQVAVTPGMLPEDPELERFLRALLHDFLTAFAADVSTTYVDHLSAAAALRGRDPHQSDSELSQLSRAVDLARELAP